ncbi:hypothetical protein E2562_038001, partial [Oryza meyeriana var. granulata]
AISFNSSHVKRGCSRLCPSKVVWLMEGRRRTAWQVVMVVRYCYFHVGSIRVVLEGEAWAHGGDEAAMPFWRSASRP